MRLLLRRGRDLGLALAVLVLLALIVLRVEMGRQEMASGPARVVDGDTLMMGPESIRLSGIDAPELRQTCLKNDAEWTCGVAARDTLKGMVQGKDIDCVTHGRDRYHRLLGVCHQGAINLNEVMVATGFAVAYGDYAGAEQTARNAGLGLWAGTFDRPQDWRTRHGGRTETVHGTVEASGGFLRRLFLFWTVDGTGR